MPERQYHERRRKLARALVAIITKEALEKRLKQRAAPRARLAAGADDFPKSKAVTNPDIGNLVAPFADLMPPNKRLDDGQPRHRHLQATGDLDERSEDVADRNIAREKQFPPRVSSARFVSSREPAPMPPPKVDVGKARFKPLIPDDVHSAVAADWNIVLDRSPLSSSSADVPRPLVIRKVASASKTADTGKNLLRKYTQTEA